MKLQHPAALALMHWPLILMAIGLLAFGFGSAIYAVADHGSQLMRMVTYLLVMGGLLVTVVALIAQ
jgi:hypothetical protein